MQGTARIGWIDVALAVAAMLLVPASLVSAISDKASFCATPYAQAIFFTMPLPDSIRTPGTHGYEFYSTWDGGDETAPFQVTFDSAAPSYPGTVYLRPGWIMVPLADGSVTDQVDTLNPSQVGRFGFTWFLNFRDTTFANSISVAACGLPG